MRLVYGFIKGLGNYIYTIKSKTMTKYFVKPLSNGQGWTFRKEGEDANLSWSATKAEAIKSAKTWMKANCNESNPGSLFISKRDGTFQEERTYPRSADPKRTKG